MNFCLQLRLFFKDIFIYFPQKTNLGPPPRYSLGFCKLSMKGNLFCIPENTGQIFYGRCNRHPSFMWCWTAGSHPLDCLFLDARTSFNSRTHLNKNVHKSMKLITERLAIDLLDFISTFSSHHIFNSYVFFTTKCHI